MINLLVYIEVLSCCRHVTHNNIGPQLSYDWLLQKNPENPPWEVLLKIKRYGTGLPQRVSIDNGRTESWASGTRIFNVVERDLLPPLFVFLAASFGFY